MLITIFYNVSNSLLVSKEWCEIVFENRNQRYGAYVLRKQTGRRYRWVALIMGGILLSIIALVALLGYFYYRAMKQTVTEVEQIVRLRPMEAEKGFEIKRISTGRRSVVLQNATPGASDQPPLIVDRKTIALPLGIDGVSDPDAVEASSLRDLDSYHNADQKDLPVEGAQLVKTEVVETMPVFPGGVQALMKFLDENVLYSGAAQRRKAEGDVRVSFIVTAEGDIADIEMEQSVDLALDRAVMTAIKRMPKWKPGRKNGVPVPVKITIPVQFRLQ